MIEYKILDENVEYCWFNSSNVIHSECDFATKKTGNKVIAEGLTVPVETVEVILVFKGGRRYVYHDVEWNDYISFLYCLGRDDNESNGKAFTNFIKPYSFEKLDNVDLEKLVELKNSLKLRCQTELSSGADTN
jgi:hypothetical protein